MVILVLFGKNIDPIEVSQRGIICSERDDLAFQVEDLDRVKK